MKSEPTLRISIFERDNPRCSVCGQQFGSEGFANNLIEAFAMHVRRQHIQAEASRADVHRYGRSTASKISRTREQL